MCAARMSLPRAEMRDSGAAVGPHRKCAGGRSLLSPIRAMIAQERPSAHPELADELSAPPEDSALCSRTVSRSLYSCLINFTVVVGDLKISSNAWFRTRSGQQPSSCRFVSSGSTISNPKPASCSIARVRLAFDDVPTQIASGMLRQIPSHELLTSQTGKQCSGLNASPTFFSSRNNTTGRFACRRILLNSWL